MDISDERGWRGVEFSPSPLVESWEIWPTSRWGHLRPFTAIPSDVPSRKHFSISQNFYDKNLPPRKGGIVGELAKETFVHKFGNYDPRGRYRVSICGADGGPQRMKNR